MTEPFKLFDVVVIRDGLPQFGVPPGTEAAVVDIHTSSKLGYEVEVVNTETGETIWWGGIDHDALDPAPKKSESICRSWHAVNKSGLPENRTLGVLGQFHEHSCPRLLHA